MKSKGYIKFSTIMIWNLYCSPQKPQNPYNYKEAYQNSSLKKEKFSESENFENNDEPLNQSQEVNFDPHTSVESYRKETLPNGWEKNDSSAEDPNDKGKKLQLLRVPYYKIVWMNLSQKTWIDTVHNWSSRTIGDPAAQIGLLAESRPSFNEPDRIAIFQPMTPLRQEAIESGYRLLGQTVQAKLDIPKYPTAIFAYMNENSNKDILIEPDDYELVYSQGAFGYNELYDKCLSPKAQMAVYTETYLQEYCKQYMPEIFGNIDNVNQRGYILDPNSGPIRWKNWFAVLSVAIWKPIPPNGYGCLSYFATNGDLNKPMMESAQNTELGPSYQAEMGQAYCLKEDYLTEGVLGEMIGQTDDKKVLFYKIKAKNSEEGFDDTNFYYAKTQNSKPDEKIWVVKKSVLKIFPDEKFE